MKPLLSYFLKGLLFLLPIIVVIVLLRTFLSFLFPLGVRDLEGVLVGVAVIAGITLLGFAVSKGVSAYLRRRIGRTFARLPLLGRIAQSAQKAFMVLRFSQDIFNRPVMVKREGGRELAFGFVTKSGLPEFGLPDHASVYLPSPFSFLGNLAIVRESDLTPVSGDPSEVVNFILSGGLAGRVENHPSVRGGHE